MAGMSRPGSPSKPTYPVPSRAEREMWEKGLPSREIANSLMSKMYPQWYKANLSKLHKPASPGLTRPPAATTFDPATATDVEEVYTEESGSGAGAAVVGVLALVAIAGGAWWYFRRR